MNTERIKNLLQVQIEKLGTLVGYYNPLNPELRKYGAEYATPYVYNNYSLKEEIVYVMMIITFISAVYIFSKKHIFTPLARKFLPSPTPKSILKFNTSAWKLISNSSLVLVGLWSLKDQWHWVIDPECYISIFKDNIMPWRLKAYYLIEMSHYIFNIVAIQCEPRMKDHWQMLMHHIVALALIFSSYHLFGVVVMILHDISDPWIEIAKIANYLQNTSIANAAFIIFALIFIISRLYIFPTYIIKTAWRCRRLDQYPFMTGTLICFFILWMMHIFWSYMIFQVFKVNIWEGQSKGDVREDFDNEDG